MPFRHTQLMSGLLKKFRTFRQTLPLESIISLRSPSHSSQNRCIFYPYSVRHSFSSQANDGGGNDLLWANNLEIGFGLSRRQWGIYPANPGRPSLPNVSQWPFGLREQVDLLWRRGSRDTYRTVRIGLQGIHQGLHPRALPVRLISSTFSANSPFSSLSISGNAWVEGDNISSKNGLLVVIRDSPEIALAMDRTGHTWVAQLHRPSLPAG